MKRFSRFLEYINESTDISIEDIDDYLLDIKDLGITYRIYPVFTLTTGKFTGRDIKSISFSLDNFKTETMSVYSAGFERKMIVDNRIWELLDEIITFKNRLENENVSIYFKSDEICISFLVGEKKSGNQFELLKLYNEIRRRHLSGKSDFHNSITGELDKNNNRIIINISSNYTDRKLNLLLRGIDLSGYDVKKSDGRFTDSAVISIAQKILI